VGAGRLQGWAAWPPVRGETVMSPPVVKGSLRRSEASTGILGRARGKRPVRSAHPTPLAVCRPAHRPGMRGLL